MQEVGNGTPKALNFVDVGNVAGVSRERLIYSGVRRGVFYLIRPTPFFSISPETARAPRSEPLKQSTVVPGAESAFQPFSFFATAVHALIVMNAATTRAAAKMNRSLSAVGPGGHF